MEILLIILGVVAIVAVVIYIRQRRSKETRRVQARLRQSASLFEQAVQYAISGEHDRAIETYESSLEFNPDQSIVPEPNLAVAYYNKGQEFAEAGKCEEAMCLFGNALGLDPDPAAIHQFQGLSFALNEDYYSAITEFDKAIIISPDNPYLYHNRGQAQAARQDFDAVIDDYTELIRLQPANTGGYRNRGKAFARNEDYDSAIVDFNKAIELAPLEVENYINRGSAFLARGNRSGYGRAMNYFTRAVEDFDEVVNLGTDDATSYTNRGLARVAAGMHEEAIEDLERARDLEPNNSDAYMNLATTYLREGYGADAQEYLNDVIILDPDCADAYFMYAAIDYRFDIVEEEGFEALDKAIALASGKIISHCRKENFTRIHGQLCCLAHAFELRADAREYLLSEDIEDVYPNENVYPNMLNDFDRLLELTPKDLPELVSNAYIKRGQLHLEVGELEKGLEELEEAVRLDSKNAKAYTIRAVAHARIGDYDIAGNDISTAIELNNDVLDTERLSLVLNRARISVAARQYDNAISDLDKVVTRFPHEPSVIFYRAVANILKGNRNKARADADRSLFADVYRRSYYPYPRLLSIGEGNFVSHIRRREGLDSDNADYWRLLGIAHLLEEDEEAAVNALTKAIVLRPDYAEAFRDRAYAYDRWMIAGAPRDYYDECERDFDEAVRLNPKDPLTYYFRGWTQSSLFENNDKAIEEFTMAIDLNLNKAEFYYSRGSAYSSVGSYKNAVKDYGEAIRLDPEWAEAYESRAEAFQKIGEDTKAAEDLRTLEEIRKRAQIYNDIRLR